ncbi:MAG: hypothetical protein KIS86_12950, partial [Devosia sp.]|nr:hypothetical protein [Devosia sp.]
GPGEDNLDFTPEAEAAMGNILVAALSALGGQDQAGAGRRLTVVTENGSVDGGHVEAKVEQPPSTPLSTEHADAIIRSGYSRGASVAELAEAIGRPGNKAYVRNRARVMGISSRDNQRAAAAAFATAQHAARKTGGDAA